MVWRDETSNYITLAVMILRLKIRELRWVGEIRAHAMRSQSTATIVMVADRDDPAIS